MRTLTKPRLKKIKKITQSELREKYEYYKECILEKCPYHFWGIDADTKEYVHLCEKYYMSWLENEHMECPSQKAIKEVKI